MKSMLAVASALALVTMFAMVPFAPNVPSSNASPSPFSSSPSSDPVPSFLTLNAPVPMFQSVTGQEITVNHQSFFIDAEDFFMNGLDNFDRTLLGNLKVAGGDTGIAISPDRHHATLKNGQTVYYGVKIAPEDREKVRGVTFILVTTPKSGIPNIRDNYFEIKYVESVGGSAGSVKSDTTAGKAYQVISPSGDYWYYFSFKAVVKSGGILTEITPVFFGGPKVAAVAEKYIVCCWEQITTPLLDVPKCIPISWWYCFPIIDLRAIWAFQCALYKKIASNTANVPCTNHEATGKSLTILGSGFNALRDTPPGAAAPLAQAIHITDEAGQAATVTSATVVSDNEIAAVIDVDRCLPGQKCVTIDGAQGHGNVAFIEVINDMTMTTPEQMSFCAAVVRGTCDKVPLTLTTTGEHVAFYTGILNIFNVTKVQTCTPTQVSFFTCGNPVNTGSYIVKGTANPGKQTMSEYIGDVADDNLVTGDKYCSNEPPAKLIDLDVDSDNNNVLNKPDRSDPKEEDREDIEGDAKKPGKYLIVNDNDSDLGRVVDFADGFNLGEGKNDDKTENEHFVPMVMELIKVDKSKAKIKISYTASDPSAVSVKDGVHIAAAGDMRIWLKDGDKPRNKAKANADNPGDYVAPGIYTASQLKFGDKNEITLYVEAITQSKTAGDRRVKVEVDADSGETFASDDDDAVRFTATEFRVIGHRGSPREMPENTERSFNKAVEEGADAIEIDLCMVKNNEGKGVEVVIWHDADPNTLEAKKRPEYETYFAFPVPVSEVPAAFQKPTHELTLTEFRTNYFYVTAKGWPDPKKYTRLDDKIPTLDEYVAWLKKAQPNNQPPPIETIRRVFLDIKVVEGMDIEKFIDKILAVLPADILQKAVLLSSNNSVLNVILSKKPPNYGYDLAYGVLEPGGAINVTDRKGGNFVDVGRNPFFPLITYGKFIANVKYEMLERVKIFDNKKKFINITIFTIDNESQMDDFLRLEHRRGGIQGIITDCIEPLRKKYREVFSPSAK